MARSGDVNALEVQSEILRFLDAYYGYRLGLRKEPNLTACLIAESIHSYPTGSQVWIKGEQKAFKRLVASILGKLARRNLVEVSLGLGLRGTETRCYAPVQLNVHGI